VVGGVDWAAKHAKKQADDARATSNKKFKGAVANMSLGGGKSVALDEAVNAAVDTGLHFAVAAGNDNRQVAG
jgi:cerevisin